MKLFFKFNSWQPCYYFHGQMRVNAKRQRSLFSNWRDCSNQDPQQPRPGESCCTCGYFLYEEAWLPGLASLRTALSELGLASSTLPASAGRRQWRVHDLPQPSWAVWSTLASWGPHKPAEWVRCSGRSPVYTSSGAAPCTPVCLEELPEETEHAWTKSPETKHEHNPHS